MSLFYRLDVALGTLGMLAAGAVIALGLSSLNTTSQVAAQDTATFAGQRFTYPHMNAAAIVLWGLAAIGIIVAVRAVSALVRHWRSQRRLVSGLTATDRVPAPADVTVICDRRPQAFCLGYLRPQICVSTGTVEALSPAELNAVLEHERHHRRQRDPLRLAAARILSDSLFFLPVLRSLTERYSALIELSADDAAVRASGGSRAALASAMLVFDGYPPSPATAVGISADRVDYLLGRPPDARLPLPRLLGAVLTLAILLALAVITKGTADMDATLGLPFVTAAPCIAVLALLPIVLAGGCLICFRVALRSDGGAAHSHADPRR